MSETVYWPGYGDEPESFVSHDDGETWIPLCSECQVELKPRSTTMSTHICPRCGVLVLIWAEDWPDADPDDEADLEVTEP